MGRRNSLFGIPARLRLAGIAALLLAMPLHAADERFTVSQVQGRAFHVRAHGVYSDLQSGSALEPDRIIKVGPKSRMDVRSGAGDLLQLGPGAEFTVAVRRLLLNEGYLAIETRPGSDGFVIEVGRWTARLAPGDYVFETQDGESTVCTISGSMRVSEGDTPLASPGSNGCLLLSPDGVAPVTLAPGDWASVEKRRKLLPVVALASRAGPIETAKPVDTAKPIDTAVSRMPGTSRVRVAAVAVPVAAIDGMLERLDRWIAQGQASRADALVASVEANPPAAGTVAPAPNTTVALATPAAPEVAPEQSTTGEWIVNVATYPSQETAEFEVKKLRAQNLAARIRPETVRGRSSYRVVIEGLASEQAANAALKTVVANEGMRKAWVFRKH